MLHIVEHDDSSVCSEISSVCSGMFCGTSQSSESEDEQKSEPPTKQPRNEKEQAETSTSKEKDAISSPVQSKYSGRGTRGRGRDRGTRGRGTRGRGTRGKNASKDKGKGSDTTQKNDESEDWLVF